jgi:hypothetical protein
MRYASTVQFQDTTDDSLLQEVNDPHTPAERLEAIIQHPNCPPNLFQRHFGRFRLYAMRNPAFPFYLLENPGFLETLDRSQLAEALAETQTPKWFVQALCAHSAPEIAEQAQGHVMVVGDLSMTWVQQTDQWLLGQANDVHEVREWLALGIAPERLRPELSRRLSLLPERPNVSAQKRYPATLDDPRCPVKTLQVAARSAETDTLIQVALHPNTPDTLLAALRALPALRATLRRVPAPTPARIAAIRLMLQQPTHRIELSPAYRFLLARHTTQAPGKPEWYEQLGLSLNPHLPPSIWERYRTNANALVRAAAHARQTDEENTLWHWR